MIQRRVLISGRVQRVGFRAFVEREAHCFPKLLGFVQNRTDGRVEVVFAGQEVEVLAMVAKCQQGPPRADVTDLEVKEESFDPTLKKFEVRFE